MKKIKLSAIVIIAICGSALMAFTGKTDNLVNTWYGQTTDFVPPYDQSFPLNSTQLAAKCPIGTAHICAVQLDGNGTLMATRKSANNYIP